MSKKLLLWGGGLLGGGLLVKAVFFPSKASASTGQSSAASSQSNASNTTSNRLGGADFPEGFSIQYPFPNSDYNQITIAYGWVESNNAAGERNHKGVDIRAALDTPIKAAGPGVVVYAQCNTEQSYYGNFVVVKHLTASGQVVYCRYAHVKEFRVQVMQQVDTNTVLALSGGKDHPCKGNSDGPHLHFEVTVGGNTRGHAIDPALVFDDTRPGTLYTSGARMPIR